MNSINEQNLIDLGSYDYDNPDYRPVEDWFFEAAEAVGLIEDEDYVIIYDVFNLRPYDKQPLVFIATILATDEASSHLEDYYGQRVTHFNRLVHELETYGRMPEDDTFIYDNSRYHYQ